jgi:hypothetical protein
MTEDREYIVNMHNLAVHEMYKKLQVIVESYDGPVVVNTLLIVLAMCGQQSGMPDEQFKAFVVKELDRLMLIGKEQGDEPTQ